MKSSSMVLLHFFSLVLEQSVLVLKNTLNNVIKYSVPPLHGWFLTFIFSGSGHCSVFSTPLKSPPSLKLLFRISYEVWSILKCLCVGSQMFAKLCWNNGWAACESVCYYWDHVCWRVCTEFILMRETSARQLLEERGLFGELRKFPHNLNAKCSAQEWAECGAHDLWPLM